MGSLMKAFFSLLPPSTPKSDTLELQELHPRSLRKQLKVNEAALTSSGFFASSFADRKGPVLTSAEGSLRQKMAAGSIQPDLYRRRGSVVQHQSSSGKPTVARIQIQMGYDFSKSDFLVSILDGSSFSVFRAVFRPWSGKWGIRGWTGRGRGSSVTGTSWHLFTPFEIPLEIRDSEESRDQKKKE